MNPRAFNYPGDSRGARVVILGTLFLLFGCVSTHAKSSKEQKITSTMPDALIGVWHRNDNDGRQSCDSYKKVVSISELGEESNPLMGSLIITKDLVHAYAEYGEGDFYAVKRVANLGDQGWKVDALVYVDTMPTEGGYADKGSFHFKVESELLSLSEMNVVEGNEHASRFFRCSEVIEGLYEDRSDTTQ